jgi:hypothetical protein
MARICASYLIVTKGYEGWHNFVHKAMDLHGINNRWQLVVRQDSSIKISRQCLLADYGNSKWIIQLNRVSRSHPNKHWREIRSTGSIGRWNSPIGERTHSSLLHTDIQPGGPTGRTLCGWMELVIVRPYPGDSQHLKHCSKCVIKTSRKYAEIATDKKIRNAMCQKDAIKEK